MAECIIWEGPKNNQGYGRCQHENKQVFVHRLAYCESRGINLSEIKGLSVMHSCDTPSCINPEHLSLGTHADNMRDMLVKGRHKPASLPGETNPSSKLTKEIVESIRAEFTGKRGQLAEMGRRYGVSYQTIYKVVRGFTWQ